MNIAIENQFTKEAIKSRMMQHAANLWGVKNPHSLDPFVRLLIEAFSTEIYRAANETQNIEVRILNKLAQMLTPNQLTVPRPAHGILMAMPSEATHVLHPHTKFSIQKRVTKNVGGAIRNEELPLSFSPTDYNYLVKGKVAYIASSYQFYGVDANGFKQSLYRLSEPFEWATCWVGLSLDKNVHNLKGVSLYFDFPSFERFSWIFRLLSLVTVKYNNQEIRLTAGKGSSEQMGQSQESIFKDYDLISKMNEDVAAIYSNRFITLDDCPVDHQSKGFPEAITNKIPEQQLTGKVPDNLVWLEIKFPVNFTSEILSDCNVAINAFPVMNKQLVQHTFSYKGLNNILPLRTEEHEHFIAVASVSDASGNQYSEVPKDSPVSNRAGFYAIRSGGVERFDQRAAQDMVNYLLELTRDEVAAFSSLDQTFIRTSLEGLSKQLQQINNKSLLIDKFIKKAPNYLVMEALSQENVQVEFWVSNGLDANQIRTGTAFRCLNNTEIMSQNLVLLSETTGGKEAMNIHERMDAYRFALESRNRLVTSEDIRNFCKIEFGKPIQSIKINKGLQPSPHPKQGYERTLDIHIIPANYQEMSEKEWSQLAAAMLSKIKKLSPDTMTYQVLIEKN